MTSLAEIAVRSIDGEEVRLGDVVDRPTILVIPRYYGCLPCRNYLRQVSERYPEVEASGGAALGVSVGAAHQARWLLDEWGIRFPLLVDPERRLYEALELPRRWWVALNPKGWWNYARAIARGSRQGRIVEPFQLPGLAILDAAGDAVWVHRGRALGDYPELDRVLAELERLGAERAGGEGSPSGAGQRATGAATLQSKRP
ncbi:MAG TPA: peroxiredoxin-like family protein [Candidatus Limnocylindrales bacterium]|nr:peroxiredoxin-like family protein [Candidatus Limnocylindrales bacterium]